MTQFARPDSDIAANGFTPSAGATLWQVLDDADQDPGNADYITKANPLGLDYAEVGLSVIGEPLPNPTLRSRAWRTGSAVTVACRVDIYEGTTLRALGTNVLIPNNTWTDITRTLTDAQTASIGDWSNLSARLILGAVLNGTVSEVRFSYMELEAVDSFVCRDEPEPLSASIYLARNSPPFSLVREIVTASDVDRIRKLSGPGSLFFRMSIAEGVAPSEGLLSGTAAQDAQVIGPDVVQEGSAVVDVSTEAIEPALWFVRRIAFNDQDGYADVECGEWSQLLYERTVPLTFASSSQSAPSIAKVLLDSVNGRNPTHITPHLPLSGMLTLLPPQPIAFGGMTAGQGFDEMALRSNSEWWIHYHAAWRFRQPTLHWAHRRGRDRRGEVHLVEGVHLVEVTYSRDIADVPRVVRFIEGGTAEIANSPSGAISVGADSQARERPIETGRLVTSYESDRRASLANRQGPASRREVLEVLPQGSGEIALLGAALRQLQVPQVAIQSAEIVVGALPRGEIACPTYWPTLDLGDVITVRLTSPAFLAGVDLDVRVTAMQPDEAAGQLVLGVEVQR